MSRPVVLYYVTGKGRMVKFFGGRSKDGNRFYISDTCKGEKRFFTISKDTMLTIGDTDVFSGPFILQNETMRKEYRKQEKAGKKKKSAEIEYHI